MVKDSNRSGRKSLLLTCLVYALGGIALYMSANLPWDKWLQPFVQILPLLSLLVPKIQGVLESLGLAGMAIAVIVVIIKPFLVIFWVNFFQEQYNKFIDSIDSNLSKITLQVSTVSETVSNYTKESTNPLWIDDCETEVECKDTTKALFKKIYGRHAKEPKSLAIFVVERILDAFCCDPHRSDVNKHIKIRENSKYKGYVSWSEVTDYKIHHVAIGTVRAREEHYFLDAKANSYAPDLNIEDWEQAVSLSVSVQDHFILKKTDKPTHKKNDVDEGFYCWKDGDWIWLRFCKNIPLETEWTKVHIDEESVNSVEDCTYTASAQKPICGHVVELDLPDGFSFIKKPVVSQEILFKGLPASMKDRYKHDEFIQEEAMGDRHIRLVIKGWILPGIIFQLFWKKNEV